MRTSISSPQFEPGSFRDPDTRVFRHNGVIFRCLTPRALKDWNQLTSTDFFGRVSLDGTLILTEQMTDFTDLPHLEPKWTAVLKHQTVPFISYPYEWPFSMLKDAALLQLDLMLAALEERMTLKDATPFNIQWIGSRPTFIDVSSFTRYEPGDPWAGYRQFCQQFLYPLFLQAHKNIPFHPWLRGSLEGITPETYRSMLSGRDYLRPGVLTHVYLQAKAQARYESSDLNIRRDLRAAGFSAALIKNNVARLRQTIEYLHWKPIRSTWSEYDRQHPYDDVDRQGKSNFVSQALARRRWSLVLDLGCNTGTYSRMAAKHAEHVLALDADHVVIDRLYRALKEQGDSTILPLVVDIVDPSPGLGWRGRERQPFSDRGSPELILCLALIHHLVIGRNIPLSELIAWLAGFGADLIIEFVDRRDPMVNRLLRNREGQEFEYSTSAVEAALTQCFSVVTHKTLESGTRTLYYAQAKTHAP